MRKGATPTDVFSMPLAAGQVDTTRSRITYKQNGQMVLELLLSNEAIDLENGWINVFLSQEQTLLFDHELGFAQVQVNLVTNRGIRIPSNILDIPIAPNQIEEVI